MARTRNTSLRLLPRLLQVLCRLLDLELNFMLIKMPIIVHHYSDYWILILTVNLMPTTVHHYGNTSSSIENLSSMMKATTISMK